MAKVKDIVKFSVRNLTKWKTVYLDFWLPGSSAGEMTLLPGRQEVILP